MYKTKGMQKKENPIDGKELYVREIIKQNMEKFIDEISQKRKDLNKIINKDNNTALNPNCGKNNFKKILFNVYIDIDTEEMSGLINELDLLSRQILAEEKLLLEDKEKYFYSKIMWEKEKIKKEKEIEYLKEENEHCKLQLKKYEDLLWKERNFYEKERSSLIKVIDALSAKLCESNGSNLLK